MAAHPALNCPHWRGAGAPSVDNLDEDDWHNLLDVENLLEAYFTQADSTHSALMGLGGCARARLASSTGAVPGLPGPTPL